jgi:hypothetical protein
VATKGLTVVGLGAVSGPAKSVSKGLTVVGVGAVTLQKLDQRTLPTVVGVGAVSIAILKISGGPQPGFVDIYLEPIAKAEIFVEDLSKADLYLGLL